jgi:thiol-disulfide isomerase/thioredoxin
MSNKFILLGLALLGLGLFYWWRMPRYGTGEAIADFSITDSQGRTTRLSDLRGKMVLVHFWGSWCGPCRQENPALADLYKTYHEKGFEVVSIAIERNPSGWAKAIERDGINWPYHAMESGDFNGPIAQQFNVHSIPAIFLVNKEGNLMAANPPLAVLGKMLSEQCK